MSFRGGKKIENGKWKIEKREEKNLTQRAQRIHKGHREEGIGGGNEVDGGGTGEGD
jgi:hypothetical protein